MPYLYFLSLGKFPLIKLQKTVYSFIVYPSFVKFYVSKYVKYIYFWKPSYNIGWEETYHNFWNQIIPLWGQGFFHKGNLIAPAVDALSGTWKF